MSHVPVNFTHQAKSKKALLISPSRRDRDYYIQSLNKSFKTISMIEDENNRKIHARFQKGLQSITSSKQLEMEFNTLKMQMLIKEKNEMRYNVGPLHQTLKHIFINNDNTKFNSGTKDYTRIYSDVEKSRPSVTSNPYKNLVIRHNSDEKDGVKDSKESFEKLPDLVNLKMMSSANNLGIKDSFRHTSTYKSRGINESFNGDYSRLKKQQYNSGEK